MGVFLDLPSAEVPGNSPCFHSLFLPTAEEEEEEEEGVEEVFLLAGEANAQRTTPQSDPWWSLGLVAEVALFLSWRRGEGSREDEKDREIEAIFGCLVSNY